MNTLVFTDAKNKNVTKVETAKGFSFVTFSSFSIYIYNLLEEFPYFFAYSVEMASN